MSVYACLNNLNLYVEYYDSGNLNRTTFQFKPRDPTYMA